MEEIKPYLCGCSFFISESNLFHWPPFLPYFIRKYYENIKHFATTAHLKCLEPFRWKDIRLYILIFEKKTKRKNFFLGANYGTLWNSIPHFPKSCGRSSIKNTFIDLSFPFQVYCPWAQIHGCCMVYLKLKRFLHSTNKLLLLITWANNLSI